MPDLPRPSIEPLESRRLLAAGPVRIVTSDFGGSERASDMALMKDGRIVVLGHADGDGRFFLARYTQDGTLDDTFGTAGRSAPAVVTGAGDFRSATSLAVDTKGRVYVAGGIAGATGAAAVARFDRDGDLDADYGTGGVALVELGENERFLDIAVDSRGNASAVGETTAGGRTLFSVARLKSDGSPDTRFGGDGAVALDFAGRGVNVATAVSLDKGGKVLVGGFDNQAGLIDTTDARFALARLNRDGSFDSRFGEGGRTVAAPGRPAVLTDLAIAKGRIVAVGFTSTGDLPDERFVVGGFRSNGQVDTSFGRGGEDGDGFVTSTFGAASQVATGVAVDRRGRILVAGHAGNEAGSAAGGRFVLARYDRAGNPDTSFGPGGAVQTEINPATGSFEQVAGVALQRGDKIVVAGNAGADGGTQDLVVVRYAERLPSSPGRVRLTGSGRNRELEVRGTDSSDVITVLQIDRGPGNDDDLVQVLVNGTDDPERVFNLGDIRRIEISGRDGDDEISVNVDNVFSVVRGEDDDDTIRVIGSGDARLSGGRGDDRIFGGDGDDLINGGRGEDRLEGGFGDDEFEADDGDRDDVNGGRGDDLGFVDFFDNTGDIEDEFVVEDDDDFFFGVGI